jgi:hypothetical protein
MPQEYFSPELATLERKHTNTAAGYQWLIGSVKATIASGIGGAMYGTVLSSPSSVLSVISSTVILGSVLNIAHKFGISALYSPNSFLSENEKEEAQKMHTIIGQIHGAVAEYNACIDLVATKTDLPVNQYKENLLLGQR